jgi:adenylate kinase family enzyme
VRRISVVGAPGAGKSTVGHQLARELGVPFLELDSIYHQPGWVPLAPEEFRRRVAEAAAARAG